MATLYLLLLLVVGYCEAGIIRVATDGRDSSTCINGGICKNLTFVLEYIRDTASTLYIKPGQYYLLSSINVTFNEIDNVTIAKDGNGTVEVYCNKSETGLSFVGSKNINITGVTFIGCGLSHISTSLNFDTSSRDDYLEFFAALYFEGCSEVNLHSITVTNSTGIAVQFYYSVHVNISNSNFTNNRPVHTGTTGGGVYIEFPFCFPGEMCIETTVPFDYVSNSQYYITGCHFTNNVANDFLNESRLILPYRPYHIAFGRGGGISVFFKGNASNIQVVIEDCNFNNNIAEYGGGVYIDMQDSSYNNSVRFSQNVLTANNATTSGGGIYISYVFLTEYGGISSGSFNIDNVIFHNNYAVNGGGLFYLSTRQSRNSTLNSLSISNCYWKGNIAKLGSALHLSAFAPVNEGTLKTVVITNNSFINNSIVLISGDVGTGALITKEIPVKFVDFVEFNNTNEGAALAAFGTKVTFAENIRAIFHNNTGYNGGAIALYSLAFIEMFPNTSFEFLNNTAKNLGGAIFVEQIGILVQNSSRNCFLRFHDITVSPYDWNTSFVFSGNKAGGKMNSIYATSVVSCILGRGYGSFIDNNISMVFCWNERMVQWKYDSQTNVAACSSQILTGIDFLHNEYDKPSNTLKVIPGKRTSMDLYAIDNQNENVTPNIVVQASSNNQDVVVDNDFNYISNNEIVLYQKNKTTNSGVIILDTIGDKIIQSELYIEFQECPPGFHLNTAGKCVCAGNFGGNLHCFNNEYYSELLRGFWIGDYKGKTVIGHCRNCDYDKTISGRIILNSSLTNISEDLLCGPDRYGTLCSQCKEGYNPAINLNDFSCVECTSTAPGAFVFLFVDMVIPVVLLAIVYFLDIPLTSGLFHGPILFGQMVTTVIILDADDIISYDTIIPQKLYIAIERIYTTCYDFFNLEVFMSFQTICLSKYIPKYATIIALHYVPAFLPLTFVAFVAVVYYYKQGGNRRFRIPARLSNSKVAEKLNLHFRNTPNVLASFILLSYTKIAIVTSYLLTPVTLISANDAYTDSSGKVMYLDGSIEYLSFEYIPYFIFALLVLLLLIVIPFCLCCFRPNKSPDRFFDHLLNQFQQEFRATPSDFYGTSTDPNMASSVNADAPEHRQIKWWFKERKSTNHHVCEYGFCTSTELFSLRVFETRWWKLPFNISFTPCYDFRWLAGALFMLRIILILPYMVAFNVIIQYSIQFVICSVSSLLVILVRPYKKNLYKYADPNVIEASCLLLLAMIIALSMYQYHYIVTDIPLSLWAYILQIVLVFIPLLWIIIACVGFLKQRCRCSKESECICCFQHQKPPPLLPPNEVPLLPV